ncbi:MAG: hypothetical protein E7563_02285 [Ruminococcaceae bacterium]|nr:hypothetical protein [Oscillospiraceae bacterium]
MKKKILLLLLTVFLVFALCGCDAITFNVIELMSPPKATGEKAEIQKLIDKEAGSDYTLKYPQNGNYRSAITTTDFDGDSTYEAIAFYMPSGEAQTVHLLIMDSIDGKWTVIGNHTSKSTAVDRLIFTDLDGDGKSEILVGWNTYNNLVKDLSLYYTQDGTSTEIICETQYSDLLCSDFTGSGKEELLLLSLYTEDKPATASLITLNDTKNGLYTISESLTSGDVVSFAKLQTGRVFYGQQGAVIDGVTSAGTYTTQLIYYSQYFASLQVVSFTGDSPTSQAERSYAVLSEDIDGDGIIEIPNTFKLNIDDIQTEAVPAALICWCEYSATEIMELNLKQVTSLVYGLRFTVPDKWGENFTAYVNYSTNEITFYQWTQEGKPGDVILIIRMFAPDVFADGVSAKGYTELCRNDSYVYTFITPGLNSEMLLTNEEVAKCFTLTEK